MKKTNVISVSELMQNDSVIIIDGWSKNNEPYGRSFSKLGSNSSPIWLMSKFDSLDSLPSGHRYIPADNTRVAFEKAIAKNRIVILSPPKGKPIKVLNDTGDLYSSSVVGKSKTLCREDACTYDKLLRIAKVIVVAFGVTSLVMLALASYTMRLNQQVTDTLLTVSFATFAAMLVFVIASHFIHKLATKDQPC